MDPTSKAALAAAKVERAARAAVRVQKPTAFLRCWARVKQKSTGSARSHYAPRYANCTRYARLGCRTCAQHKGLEKAAQALP